jgi:hypothetical protein
MKPVMQSRVGEDGTCFLACLASIFEVPESDIPDFEGDGDDEYWSQVQDFLGSQGLKYRRVPITGKKPVGYSTIEGISPRGGLHACVAKDGVLVHDPHPQDGTGRGLVEPRYYGLLEPVLGVTGLEDSRQKKLGLDESSFGTVRRTVRCPHCGLGYTFKRNSEEALKAFRQNPHPVHPACIKAAKEVQAKDRTDVATLRKNTEKQGGPFFIQETEKTGNERTIPVRELSKGADGVSPSVVALFAALWAWYKAQHEEPEPTYDLTKYQPKRKTFDVQGFQSVDELLRKLGWRMVNSKKREWNNSSYGTWDEEKAIELAYKDIATRKSMGIE